MSRPAPVPRQNHASLISETLRDEILRGLLPPGKRLAEPRLAERFGVSRAPVREALLELSADGFLEFPPGGPGRIPVPCAPSYAAKQKAKLSTNSGSWMSPCMPSSSSAPATGA